MFGLNLKSLLSTAILILLAVSLIIMTYNMYSMAYSVAYQLDATGKATVTGKDASTFWAENKLRLMVPSITNVLSMALIGILLVK